MLFHCIRIATKLSLLCDILMNDNITIITATYNAEDTLAQALASVADQKDVMVEKILIDGESTDETLSIAKRFKLDKILTEPDKGIYDAMNKGIELAKGEIIGILNADDFYPSDDVLQKVVEAFRVPEIDACYGDLRYVDCADISKTVRYWHSGSFNPNKFYWGWMPPHPAFFVRRSVYEKYGSFHQDLGTAADYEIMLRFLLKHQLKTAYIPQVLVHMRRGGASNVNIGNRIKANMMDRKAWKKNGLRPYPWTLWVKPVRKIGQWIFTGRRE